LRFSITHQFNYAYDSPVRLSTQYLRLTPRDTTRQKVLEWMVGTPGQALRTTDGYGNVLHVLTIDKPVTGIAIQAQGSVETAAALDEASDFTGAPLSPLLFLRPTGLTRADEALGAFAEKFRRGIGTLAGLRELAAAIHAKNAEGSAADAAHTFIACCRYLGVPARYVSGYMYSTAQDNHGVAMHAWCEAWVGDRWRSFDIAHDSAVGEAHVKIAVGADYLDACPVRGVRVGGGAETLVAQAQVQASE
jgi:transglutaminase-like putative cysteine protease